MIDVQNLQVIKAHRTICQVDQLSVAEGERVGVIGTNGIGKTTLLRVLASLERPDNGNAYVNAPTRQCVYVHQAPIMFRGTVLSNTDYGLRARGVPRAKRLRLARQWLARFQIGHLERRRGRDLSGGEQRRVALARAFAVNPRVLLLDEPVADLDQQGVARLAEALDQVPDTTVLIALPFDPPPSFGLRCVFMSSGDTPGGGEQSKSSTERRNGKLS